MRETYLAAERKYKWLPSLLDTYAIADEEAKAIRERHLATGMPIACAQGCSACCKNPTVPITQPEVQGISWYVSEVLDGDVRVQVKTRLETHKSTTECAFLVENKCAIYPVRPLSCRQFMMQGQPCEVGEHVEETRPADIVFPSDSSIQKAAVQLLHFWEFPNRKARIEALESGFIADNAQPMHLYKWEGLAKTMAFFDTLKT